MEKIDEATFAGTLSKLGKPTKKESFFPYTLENKKISIFSIK